MGMFGAKGARSGSWVLRSKTDDRWNCSGDTKFYNIFDMPNEAREMMDQLKEKYGDPPSDLMYSCMKD